MRLVFTKANLKKGDIMSDEELELELEQRRSRIINVAVSEKVNIDDYVGTWKSCGFSKGIGKDGWWDWVKFENSTLRYLQFFPNGDLWFTGDWTREKSWSLDDQNVETIKHLHSWNGKDTFHSYGKVDHPQKNDSKLIKQDNKLYFHWNNEQGGTYYVLEKVSDDPEIKLIK